MPHRLTSEEAMEVLDLMDVAVMIADIINGGSWVTWVNPAFTRVFGYTLEEMIDGAIHSLIGPHTDEDEIQRMYAEVRAGNRATITSVGYCADGRERWMTFTASPVFAGERVVRWIGVQHDVSEHVRRSESARKSYEIERRARIGLSLVGEASDVMADVDAPDTLGAVAQMLSRRLVAWAGFFVLDRQGLRELSSLDWQEPDGGRQQSQPTGHPGDPVVAAASSPLGWVRELALFHDYPERTPADELASRLRRHRAEHPGAADRAMVVPLVGRTSPLGLLAVLPHVTDMRVAESAAELTTIVELVARRVGLALENAQLFARERALAETLQRAMLPEQEVVEGLDVWTYYAPSAEHVQVGGDWYDVIHVGAETVGIVIGDVAGHDIEAAAVMGQLRSVVRAYACEFVEPELVLGRVDSLAVGMGLERFASLAYAALTPGDGGWDVRYTVAGQLPPLLVRGGTVLPLDEGHGMVVGFCTPERSGGTVRAEPGDVLVFYTDGLTERRSRNQCDGFAALSDLCRRLIARDAAGVGEELLAALGQEPEDDLAVVVVRVPDPAANGAPSDQNRSRRWRLPADRSSIGRARHAVRGALAGWGIGDSQAVELVVSELVANAVLHGSGRVGLVAERTDQGVRLEVTDSNPEPPAPVRGELVRSGGYGMHVVDRLASWGWREVPEGKLVWALVPEPGLAGP